MRCFKPLCLLSTHAGALFVRGQLDTESNLCFGEGGAGTWSDGKLTTRVGRNSDPVRAVLLALHAFGAPDVSWLPARIWLLGSDAVSWGGQQSTQAQPFIPEAPRT